MKTLVYKLLVISLLLPTHALATTSGSKYIADPIDGSECRVKVVKSYGSYIYQKRSKYDQVFRSVLLGSLGGLVKGVIGNNPKT